MINKSSPGNVTNRSSKSETEAATAGKAALCGFIHLEYTGIRRTVFLIQT